MTAASAAAGIDPPLAGGAMPETPSRTERLLGFLQRFKQTGIAMARGVSRIARQRLHGVDLSKLGPAGFNPTLANGLVGDAMAWTAALRERLLAVVRPALVPDPHKATRTERAPQARGQTLKDLLPACVPNPTEADWHNYRDLAEPVRVGQNGVAFTEHLIAGLSDRQVVTEICGFLRRAAQELGAEADVARIDAMKAAALALCPEADPTADGPADGDEAKVPRAAASSSDESKPAAGDDPAPQKPPD
jgi:hypothetical protein